MLRVRLLGTFEAWVDDRPILQSDGIIRKFFVFLILKASVPQTRSFVLKHVWPVSDDGALSKAVARLRKELGPEGDRLITNPGTVQLDISGADIDTSRFESLIDQGDRASLDMAIKLYRGPLLPGWGLDDPTNWHTADRKTLATTYDYALERLVRMLIQENELGLATRYLKDWLRTNLNNTWAWETLISTQIDMGLGSEAEIQYHSYLKVLSSRAEKYNVPQYAQAALESKLKLMRSQAQARTLEQVQNTDADKSASPRSYTRGYTSTEGAIPLTSPYYVKRDKDAEAEGFQQEENGYTIRIRGPRQTGKSSLLVRMLEYERSEGAKILFTDWGSLTETELASEESFFRALAADIADQMGDHAINSRLDLDLYATPRLAFQALLESVLRISEAPVVWGVDKADRIFNCPFRDDVFSIVRGWHNFRSIPGKALWQRLSLILTYSTDASLFISNLNESPFNIGATIDLKDLTPAEATKLNAAHSSPMSSEQEVHRLYAQIGGQPNLWRRALSQFQTQSLTPLDLIDNTERLIEVFHSHLSSLTLAISSDVELKNGISEFLADGKVSNRMVLDRLLSAGVLSKVDEILQFRCRLYKQYLSAELQ